MDRLPALSRRSFVRLGLSAAALSPLAGLGSPAVAAEPVPDTGTQTGDRLRGLKLGIASYSFSKLPLDQAIEAIQRLGVGYVSIKDAHLPLKSGAEQRKQVAQKFRDAGIIPMSCGNITLSNDESEIRNAFEYARDAGIPTIVCNPTRESLPVLDRLVKEYDIKLAIHNHGPENKVWPSPYEPWEAIQSFDPRIGLCIDVGHTARAGVDPTEAIRKCSARLYDVHLKDLSVIEVKSKVCEVGRGVLDLRGILQALIDQKFSGLAGLEYEKDMKDPVAGAAESIGYLRGVISGLRPASA